jgi:hypothetical protein
VSPGLTPAARLLAVGLAVMSCRLETEPGISANGGQSGNGNGSSQTPGGGGNGLAPMALPDPNSAPMAVQTLPACAAQSAKAQPVPVDLYIIQDKSGSMSLDGKWAAVSQALIAFVQSPSTAGINVGLGFFPLDGNGTQCPGCMDFTCLVQCGCVLPLCNTANSCTCQQWGISCSAVDYAVPAVSVAALPGVGTRIVEAINMTRPNGATPTRAALEGAFQYARSWQMMTNRRIAVALATDGIPEGCASNSVQEIADLAAAAAANNIFTFVIGVGPALGSLNAIAVGGNTKVSYPVDSGNIDQFIQALKMVQTQAAKLACTFSVPPAPMGQTLDPDKVNVRFSPTGDPTKGSIISQVSSKGACGTPGGWYYDNPAAPTSISLCDTSCQSVNGQPNGEVGLLFGCKTMAIK